MPPREAQDQIDLIVHYEMIDRIHEIQQPDEIEFGVVGSEACFQFAPFCLVFFRHLYIMLMIHIDDMQARFEEVQNRFYGVNGYREVKVLEIGEQHYVLGRSGTRTRRNDDHRYDPPFYDI